MKKLLTFAVWLSVTSVLCAQNTSVSDELSSLKKQVSTLNSKNAALEQKVKEIKRSSQTSIDSLLAQVNGNNQKIKTLQDSVAAKDAAIATLRTRTELFFHSLKLRKTALYIILPLFILIIILIYWLLTKKIKTEADKSETLSLNLKKSLEEALQNSKKDLQSEIASAKESLEHKIAALNKNS